MNLDFILMALCVFAAVCMASKKNSETEPVPDIKRIIYTVLAVAVTLVLETLVTRFVAALSSTGFIITSAVGMILRFIGIVLALFILAKYKPSKQDFITLVLCIPLILLISRSYYLAILNELAIIKSGDFLQAATGMDSSKKIGIFYVLVKSAPSLYLLTGFWLKNFLPPKDTEDNESAR